MFRIASHRSRLHRRRGSVLIVVLALLALFAVVGLSFVLYAESQSNQANSNKRGMNDRGSVDDDAAIAYKQAVDKFLVTLIHGTNDAGDDLAIPLRGHSLAESKYGRWRANGVPDGSRSYETQVSHFPFAGYPLRNESLTLPGLGAVDRRQIVRYTWDQTNNFVVEPERYYNGAAVRNNPNAALPGTYWNAAVPYTYPDRQANFFLGMFDATTGEIIAQSFFRRDLFGDPAKFNAVLADPLDKYRTLRPTKNDHPNFPNVPANPDGTFTGDVSNLRYINNTQKNDSFWLDFGAPVQTLGGRRVKPMVAPLIIDLSGKVNLSVAGNMRPVDPTIATSPIHAPGGATHTSHEGYGVWEINPTAVFAAGAANVKNAELFNVIQRRFPTTSPNLVAPGDPNVVGTRMFDLRYGQHTPGGYPFLPTFRGWLNRSAIGPHYSRTALDGRSAAAMPDPILYPGTGTATPFPTLPTSRYAETQAAADARLNYHPHMFNPLLYTPGRSAQTGADRPFGVDDVVRQNARHNDAASRYKETLFATAMPTNADSAYTRHMTTTFSITQEQAMLPLASNTGSGIQFVNLPPVDVNRWLQDYRRNVTLPYSALNLCGYNTATNAFDINSTTYSQYASARRDRQNLARDIFVRLCGVGNYHDASMTTNPKFRPLLDGTRAFYNPNSGYIQFTMNFAAPNAAEALHINELRKTAQLAANIVDAIDGDDINTAFVWNPLIDGGTGLIFQPVDPSGYAGNFAAGEIGNRVVYGTELPRLVLSEVYSQLVNKRTDAMVASRGAGLAGNGMMNPAQDLHREYFVELHNPLNLDLSLSDGGAARLKYVQNVTQAIDPVPPNPTVNYPGTTFSPYRLEIAAIDMNAIGADARAFSTSLGINQGNVTGDLSIAASDPTYATLAPKLRITNWNDTRSATVPVPPAAVLAGDERHIVRPANNSGAGVDGGNNGYLLVGPQVNFPSTAMGAVPNTSLRLDDAAAVPNFANPVEAMDYSVGGKDMATATARGSDVSTVVLRRLMNPYRPAQPNANLADYNPYITIDYVENVPTRSRIDKLQGGANAVPGPAVQDTASIGRIHPYAAAPCLGFGAGTQEAVVEQVAGGATPPVPAHTLFGLNSPSDNARTQTTGETKGFEWLVHFDRQLVNSLELLHVSTDAPWTLTQRFAQGKPLASVDATGAMLYHRHTFPRSTPNGAVNQPMFLDFANAFGSYAALEFLKAGNSMPGIPVGGREPGKVNVNAVFDVNLLNAVLDPQKGNRFTTVQTAAIGNALLQSRSPHYASASTMQQRIRSTVSETSASPNDNPIQGIQGLNPFFQDATILRPNPPTTVPASMFSNPNAQLTLEHPYSQYEPLRKGWNNFTTVGDSFLLLFTIGFFEVENDAPYNVTNQPRLGKEAFSVAPGDLRQAYATIIDRSQIYTSIVNSAGTGTTSYTDPNNTAAKPWQAKLSDDAHIGSKQIVVEADLTDDGTGTDNYARIYIEGASIKVKRGNFIYIGTGEATTALGSNGDGELFQVSTDMMAISQKSILDPAGNVTAQPSRVVLKLNGTLNRSHPAGSPVRNAQLGNPGPAPNLTFEHLRARGVVPYLIKLDP